MKSKDITLLMLADFTLDPITFFFKEEFKGLAIKPELAPINQIQNIIYNSNHELWEKKPNITVVWSQAEKQLSEFNKLANFESFNKENLEKEVIQFAESIKIAARLSDAVFVTSWTMPPFKRGFGLTDCSSRFGVRYYVNYINALLFDSLSGIDNIFVLDSERWISSVNGAYDPKMWYIGKILYSRDFFRFASDELKASIGALYGKTVKLVVCDLDNTLWGGIIGDDGIEGVKLGGIDPVGEAFVDFQKYLLSLKNRGIILAIASKNEESVALEAIEKHPAMVLKKEDFSKWKINWNDKAENIRAITEELNLGLQSVLFLDDSSFERSRVREALPEVYVPELPESPIYYFKFLTGLSCFDQPTISEEDKMRNKFYKEEEVRKKEMHAVSSLDEWLHSLELKVVCDNYSDLNKKRVVQLLNKTNQFNFITRRMDQSGYDTFAAADNVRVKVISCKDKIGDYGIIGLVSYEIGESEVEIHDFVLSCRAMGREVEKAMLYCIAKETVENKITSLSGTFIPTQKNKPSSTFYQDNGFKEENGKYYNKSVSEISQPAHIELIFGE